MTFDKQLFISYAHLDNEPLTKEQQGWITRFHGSLSALLSMRLGRKAEIWRDSKLKGSDIFADEIVQQFASTAVLVSVLTPRYVESEWCTREAREFCKAAQASGGVVVDNQSRVFKIIKTPVDSEDTLPAVMKDALGHHFYILDERSTPIELDPAYGEELAEKYNIKVAQLAWELAQLIKKLESRAPARVSSTPAPASTKPCVYLAECGYDRREAREAIAAELRLHGYTVLPDHQLPRDEAAYIADVTNVLSQCKLSVHLVGSSSGAVPDGPSEKSVVVLQNELAVARSKQVRLERVIWLPEGTRSDVPRQQQFIASLQSDAQAQLGADVITAGLDHLKGAIHAALEKLEKPQTRTPKPRPGGVAKRIYLVCDERDRKDTIPIRKLLKAHGHDVQIPLFEGDAAAVRQGNHELLTQADAVLLFYGAGAEAWKHSVEADLRKSKADRGDRPLPVRFTYLANPVTVPKTELIEMDEPNLINGLQGFSESQLMPFLDGLVVA